MITSILLSVASIIFAILGYRMRWVEVMIFAIGVSICSFLIALSSLLMRMGAVVIP